MRDAEHLRLLSIFYYILGGLTALFACIPIIHVLIGIAMVRGLMDVPNNPQQAPPEWVGWLFIGFGSLAIVVGWASAIGMIFTARSLKQRRRYIYCIIVAAICCLSIPFGTALGVCTIIVLCRPSVQALFNRPGTKPVPLELDLV